MLGGIGLDLMAAIPVPHDQPHPGRGGIAERHRRAGFGLHFRARKYFSPIVPIYALVARLWPISDVSLITSDLQQRR
jgi:hypothetical protein